MIHISDDQQVTEEHRKALIGLAFDSIPKQIILPLKVLARHKAVTTKGIAQDLNYPSETVLKWLQNINVTQICDRRQIELGKPDMWVMRDQYKDLICKYLNITPVNELLVDPDTEEEGSGTDINPSWMNKSDWGTDDPVEAREREEASIKQFDMFINELKEDDK